MVREATGRPVALDAHPKHTMAMGAAFVAEERRDVLPVAAATTVAAAAPVAASAASPDPADRSPALTEEPVAGPALAPAPAPAGDGVRARRMLPVGLAVVGVAAVATVAIAANLMGGGAGAGSSPSPSAPASQAVVPSPSPSVAASASPSPVVTPSPEPTPTPAPTPTPTPAGRQARITGITVSGGRYVVDYDVFNFEPKLPGDRHVHFFFDTVPPLEAGVPGSGPWILYAGPVPFREYRVSDRPSGARRMCILVARADHSVVQDTGNCVDLPS
jgi:hypothetical protein